MSINNIKYYLFNKLSNLKYLNIFYFTYSNNILLFLVLTLILERINNKKYIFTVIMPIFTVSTDERMAISQL